MREILEFGIDTSEELEALILKRKNEVMNHEKKLVENRQVINPRADFGVFFSFAGLIRNVMRFEDSEKYLKIREKK